jgi:hypothetical protein
VELISKKARVTRTPTDGRGSFDFTISAFNTTDTDNERIAEYKNVTEGEDTEVKLDYAHIAAVGGGADPLASRIGTATVTRRGNLMTGSAKLDLENPVGEMVYSRVLLPADDPAYLGEVSVWFAFSPEKTTHEGDVRIIHDAELLSVAVVKAGAQATTIENVKNRVSQSEHERNVDWMIRQARGEFDHTVPSDPAAALRMMEKAAGLTPTPEPAKPKKRTAPSLDFPFRFETRETDNA